MRNRFYEFKNQSDDSVDLYIYGAITDDKESDWFSCDSDVDLKDFKEALDKLNDKSTLNIFVNSPGGSVFAASTMASMLQRAKETKGIKIISWVDGLCASAASFLIMPSDEIKLYTNSMLMIHKPLSIVFGNADDMQKEIEVLNKIQENVMIPMYMKKAKCDEDEIRELINNETWLSAEETNEYFNVSLLNCKKECEACVDKDLFKRYKNVPEELKEESEKENDEPVKEQETEEVDLEETLEETENIGNGELEPRQQEVVENQSIDYSYFENKLNQIRGGKNEKSN